MNVTFDQFGDEARDDAAVVFVVSDSLGESANNVVLSAAAQFSDGAVRVVRLSQIESAEDVSNYLDEHEEEYVSTAVFHSIVRSVKLNDGLTLRYLKRVNEALTGI